MTTARRRAVRRTALAGLLAAPALALSLAPAFADSTPIPSEPPGGATCAPGVLTATCGQDKGTTGSSTGTKSGSTSGATGGTGSSSSRHSSTGTTTVTSLPRTGPADALPYGLAGSALLVVGAALVVGSRRSSH